MPKTPKQLARAKAKSAKARLHAAAVERAGFIAYRDLQAYKMAKNKKAELSGAKVHSIARHRGVVFISTKPGDREIWQQAEDKCQRAFGLVPAKTMIKNGAFDAAVYDFQRGTDRIDVKYSVDGSIKTTHGQLSALCSMVGDYYVVTPLTGAKKGYSQKCNVWRVSAVDVRKSVQRGHGLGFGYRSDDIEYV